MLSLTAKMTQSKWQRLGWGGSSFHPDKAEQLQWQGGTIRVSLCERLLLPAGQAEAPALAATQRPTAAAAVAPEQRRSAARALERRCNGQVEFYLGRVSGC